MALSDGKLNFKAKLKTRLLAMRDNTDKEYENAIDDFLLDLADELEIWIINNANVTVPATGLLDSNGLPCTGNASGNIS